MMQQNAHVKVAVLRTWFAIFKLSILVRYKDVFLRPFFVTL